MRRAHSLIGTALLLLGIASCREAEGGNPATARDPNFRPFSPSDREMQAAIARARASTGELLRRLEQPPRSQTFLSVKVRLADGRGAEHIWLDSLRYDGRRLSGRLNDTPMVVRNRRHRDVVHVMPGDITDWIAIDAGRLCGGFTTRVARRRLPAADRSALERDPRFVRVPGDTSSCAAAG